ncbi:DUF4344 domain-containing metallopeptidase [Roseofilum sp. BLCC_M154]|uniref:DUF4344 domain-containing metallopeptidase n=1 Tax=Roseofilum acuticapitatum BLCC-M154 TaxID=3022444 RepID=A0ABT7AWN0_9CYAN|nr:DUF4344 domain-containing metallopeptidase [Roseofilum acuticapitatum]MDJ1171312.1 DUF4344 domain-containing metallopeptidase [Roseofilum acuticapitatum BLCC-M154]
MFNLNRTTQTILNQFVTFTLAMVFSNVMPVASAAVSAREARTEGLSTEGIEERWLQAQRSGGGRVRVVYHEGTDARSREVIEGLRQIGAFDEAATTITNGYYLPEDITINIQQCDSFNSSYNSISKSIRLCINLLTETYDTLKEAGLDDLLEDWRFNFRSQKIAVSGFLFVFYHELAHALMDVFDERPMGMTAEEIEADTIAALLFTDSSKEDKQATLIWFGWLISTDEDKKPAYYDEHPVTEQRFYNIYCLWHGEDPTLFGNDLARNTLQSREIKCSYEYENAQKEFNRMMEPHRRENRSSSPSSAPASSSNSEYIW